MRNYPYKVRVLAAVDQLYDPKTPTKSLSPNAIETTFRNLCVVHDIPIPSTWKKRTHLVLDSLVADGWLIRNNNGSVVPSPRLRKLVADEKLRLNVPQSSHELRIFATVANKMKTPGTADTPARPSSVSKTTRRRSTRPSLTREELPSSSPVAEEAIVLQPISTRPRQSDPGPLVVITNGQSRRRVSLGRTSASKTPTSKTPATTQRRSSGPRKEVNRRHTLAVVEPSRRQIPSGKAEEIQFLPFKQTLSLRTRRALRRNGISEEQIQLEQNERSHRKKSREEVAKLRAELDKSKHVLSELQRELEQLRHAPSQEPEPFRLNTVPEEPEDSFDNGMDVDVEDTFGQPIPYHDEPESVGGSPEPPTFLRTPPAMSPAISRQNSSIGESPVSKRDKRIRELELQIARLNQDIERQAEDAEIYHDAEEQILLEENSHLHEQLEEIQSSPPANSSIFQESSMIQTQIQTQTQTIHSEEQFVIDDETIDAQNSPSRRKIHDSGIVASSMMVDEVDPRLEELEEENDRLLRDFARANAKLEELEEEVALAAADSEEAQRRCTILKQEREALKQDQDVLQQQIEDLITERARHMEEYEKLEGVVEDQWAQIDELKSMHAAISSEKSGLEKVIEECKAEITSLEDAVSTGRGDITKMQSMIDTLNETINELNVRNSELQLVRDDMETEVSALRGEVEARSEEVEGLKIEILGYESETANKDALVGSLHQQIRALQDRTGGLEQQITNFRQEIDVLRATIGDRDQTIKSLEFDKSTLENHTQRLTSDIEGLNQRLDSVQQERLGLLGTIEQRTGENTVLSRRINDLEELNHTLSSTKDALLHEKGNLQAQVEDLNKIAQLSADERNKLKNSISDLETQISELEDVIRSKEQTEEDFREDIKRKDSQLSAMEKAADNLESENESLENDIETLRAKITALEADIEAADEEKDSLNGQLLDARAQLGAFEQSSEAAAHEKERLEGNIANLKAEVEGTKKALRVSATEKQQLIDQLAKLNNQIEDMEDEIDALKSEREVMRRDIANHRSRISALEGLLNVANADRKALEKEVTKLQQDAAVLEDLRAESAADNDHLRQTIEDLNADIVRLSRQAEQIDEQQRIVVQKMHPYINGTMPWDMAVDEVLNALVLARNSADENREHLLELERKVKTLVSISSTESPQELLERFTDQFKELRSCVERLHAENQEAPYNRHNIGGSEWKTSNEYALGTVQNLMLELAEHLREVREEMQSLNNEKDRLTTYCGDIEEVLQLENAPPDQLAEIIHRQMSELEDKVAEQVEKIKNLKEELQEKQDTIERLNGENEQQTSEIEELEREVQDGKQRESELEEEMKQKENRFNQALREAHQERVLTVGAIRNKFAQAVDTKNHLQTRLEEALASHSSEIAEMERLAAEANHQIQSLETDLQSKKTEYEQMHTDYEGQLAEAERTISDLEQQVRSTEAKREYDIAALQTQYDQLMTERDNRIRDVLAEKDSLVASHLSELKEKEAAIGSLKSDVTELLAQEEQQRIQLQGTIDGLKDCLTRTTHQADMQEAQLQKQIADLEEYGRDLEKRCTDLEHFLGEAEEHEAELEATLEQTNSDHQITLDKSARDYAELFRNKETVSKELAALRVQLEETEEKHASSLETLQHVIANKVEAIDSISAALKKREADIFGLEVKVVELESTKQRLEQDLQTERTKGVELVNTFQKEADRFISRFGDIKNGYLVEQKQRETRKRARGDDEEDAVDLSHAVGMLAPPSPSSTSVSRRVMTITSNETVAVNKRRRVYGDSGVGLDVEDEGFEGSVANMSMA